MMRNAVGAGHLAIYAGHAGFLAPELAAARTLEVASANWHASATLVAGAYRDGLLVDVGTTTTDMIPLKGGAPASREATDGERLTEGELRYAGVVRTPVMAVWRVAPFEGRMQGIAAERFATMADVYRLTGDLPDDADPYPSARSPRQEPGGKRRAACAHARPRRVRGWRSRMGRGRTSFAELQLSEIVEAAARLLIAREALGGQSVVIGAGCGRFLARAPRPATCGCPIATSPRRSSVCPRRARWPPAGPRRRRRRASRRRAGV